MSGKTEKDIVLEEMYAMRDKSRSVLSQAKSEEAKAADLDERFEMIGLMLQDRNVYARVKLPSDLGKNWYERLTFDSMAAGLGKANRYDLSNGCIFERVLEHLDGVLVGSFWIVRELPSL